MSRKKRPLATIVGLLILLIGLPCGLAYRQVESQVEQARKDQALIAAIKARNDKKTLELLAEGANGEARDGEKPLTLREALLHLWDRLRHPGRQTSKPPQDGKHLPALLLYFGGDNSSPEPGLKIAQALLDHGARVEDRNEYARTPLMYASQFTSGDLATLLLARGANIEAKDIQGDTPLMGASLEATKVLMKHGANIEAKNQLGFNPLAYAAPDVAKVLLEHGANIEAKDKDNRTPLMWEADDNNPQYDIIAKVRLLLEHGANVSAKDAWGRTPLELAKGNPIPEARKIITLLRRHGAKESP